MKKEQTKNKFAKLHRELIESAHGIVDDIFVLKTGVIITKKSQVTSEALALFEKMNIDTECSTHQQHAEFNSRITYLSFPEEKQDAAEYHEKLIKKYGHRSIYNDEYVTFLIAGCALETALEFTAHNEATIARLTSSKTNAQNTPLFKLLGKDKSFHEKQKKMIYDYLKYKDASEEEERKGKQKNEFWNILNFGNKVISFTITMSIKDWHKTLIGRLSQHGVESDMLKIMEEIAKQLKNAYPLFFNEITEYYQMGNQQKYEGD